MRKCSLKNIIGDKTCNEPNSVKRVLLTSGKHYYTLREKQASLGVKDTAILRLESFCPFPTLELQQEISKFPKANCKYIGVDRRILNICC